MKNLFILIFLFISTITFCQIKIGYIEFHFSHSLRISNNTALIIAIENTGKRPQLRILKDSYIGEEKLEEDHSVYLFKKEYERIIEEIQKINIGGMLNEPNAIILDGTSTRLILSDSGWNDHIEFNFGTPNADTEKRGLTNYYEACRLIIKAAGLNPDDYF